MIIRSSEAWGKLNPGEKYFVTRNLTSLLAFSIGGKFDPKTGCLKVLAAHTDSPAIKFAPNTKACRAGYLQVWHI